MNSIGNSPCSGVSHPEPVQAYPQARCIITHPHTEQAYFEGLSGRVLTESDIGTFFVRTHSNNGSWSAIPGLTEESVNENAIKLTAIQRGMYVFECTKYGFPMSLEFVIDDTWLSKDEYLKVLKEYYLPHAAEFSMRPVVPPAVER